MNDGLRSWLQLPPSMTDFARRGFNLARPQSRLILERHAAAFVAGANLAARGPDLHAALASVPAEERGFAYEGAGLRAGISDRLLPRGNRLAELLAGPGQAYPHLIHVGSGWAAGMLRLPGLLPSPAPLLGWLALDGAGFARTFFAAGRRLDRELHRPATATRRVHWSGAGRALWFVAAADPQLVAQHVLAAGPAARPELWAGVGLACCYAGGADEDELRQLARSADTDLPALQQGVLFAAAARSRSGVVPDHTAASCRVLTGLDVDEAARWTDEESVDLLDRTDIDAFDLWRQRLRQRAAATLTSPTGTSLRPTSSST